MFVYDDNPVIEVVAVIYCRKLQTLQVSDLTTQWLCLPIQRQDVSSDLSSGEEDNDNADEDDVDDNTQAADDGDEEASGDENPDDDPSLFYMQEGAPDPGVAIRAAVRRVHGTDSDNGSVDSG